MRRLLVGSTIGLSITLAACGGDGGGGNYGGGDGGGGGGGTTASLTSFVGTTDAFAAWGNALTGDTAVAPTGSFAGKRQVLRGTIDPVSGQNLGQLAGVEIYKYTDGHVYVLDLTTTATPQPQQASSESLATVDDTCSLNGTGVAGANSDYLGVDFVSDLNNITNSRYFYRLPGVDGVCDTSDDVIQRITPATPANVAPTTVPAMPSAAVHDQTGAITGFVAKSGASLLLYDANFANPVTLGTFGATIQVATVLPLGTTQGFVTGQLFEVDGNIVYVNYATPSISPTLFTVPGETLTSSGALFAASPTTLYFAINTPASGSTPISYAIYSMPADGSAAPTPLLAATGHVTQMQFPVQSTSLVYSVYDTTFTIYALAQGSTSPVTALASSQNGGQFTATSANVYYTTWSQTVSGTLTTRTSTTSGANTLAGAIVIAPVANSLFSLGGEYAPWPLVNGDAAGAITSQTALETVFQVQGLTPVTVTNSASGITYTVDGVSGGTVYSYDTASNQMLATVGQIPVGTATYLTATFRSDLHAGFLEAYNLASTQDPSTRDIYFVDSYNSNTLEAVTNNL